ncbi:MAG TPA: AzlD domain-containing protein [Steroidobacteraceae bacterium]|nr:AzlD domain-containing protein [Steroidobacteraceae bacterium]
MNATLRLWLAIVGIGLTGVVTRCSFLVLGERLRLPPVAERALKHAPAVALAAIIAPALLLVGGRPELALGNQRLWAALVASVVMGLTRSMLWTIAVGLAAFTLLRLYA